MENRFTVLSLNGDYTLSCLPHTDYIAADADPTCGSALAAFPVLQVPAQVPGNVELDLCRAGLVEDPFYSTNAEKLYIYENYHFFYQKKFEVTKKAGLEYLLRFDGIDTVADVYLNGVLLGHTENMLIPHTLSASSLQDGENELFVHIYPACIEARKYPLSAADCSLPYTFESLVIRKAAHSFGWDIMPRAVSAGLWRDVSLEALPPARIEESYLYILKAKDLQNPELAFFYRVSVGEGSVHGWRLSVDGECGDSRFHQETELWFTTGKLFFRLENPRLWWPVGRGPQDRYTVTVRLYQGDTLMDTHTFRTGLRTTALRYTQSIKSAENPEFVFIINGEKVFIKGSNWVPADAYHSRDRERIPKLLSLWSELGCNGLRCWGGSVYEDEEFFDLCDEMGLVVWMDFCMGCGSYPQDERLQRMLSEEAEIIVKKLRHHPSICLWAGDNENDMFMADDFGTDPNHNVLTRQVLPQVLRANDPTRPYLPSSPYVSPRAFAEGIFNNLPEEHLWGPRDYFKSPYYLGAKAAFASEMGYHGCPSPSTLKKFCRPEYVWNGDVDNPDWMFHAASPDDHGNYSYRNRLMRSHVETLFGIKEADSLDTFARASQISQAEAKKYFIERFRCRKWARTGLMWWNVVDGWPQISDAVVDYYLTKKLAFGYIQRSQKPVCLMFDEPEDGFLTLVGCNDLREDVSVRFTLRDMTDGGRVVLTGEGKIPGDTAAPLARLPYDGTARTFYYISWDGDAEGTNHYLAGRPPYDLQYYLSILKELDYDTFEGFEV